MDSSGLFHSSQAQCIVIVSSSFLPSLPSIHRTWILLFPSGSTTRTCRVPRSSRFQVRSSVPFFAFGKRPRPLFLLRSAKQTRARPFVRTAMRIPSNAKRSLRRPAPPKRNHPPLVPIRSLPSFLFLLIRNETQRQRENRILPLSVVRERSLFLFHVLLSKRESESCLRSWIETERIQTFGLRVDLSRDHFPSFTRDGDASLFGPKGVESMVRSERRKGGSPVLDGIFLVDRSTVRIRPPSARKARNASSTMGSARNGLDVQRFRTPSAGFIVRIDAALRSNDVRASRNEWTGCFGLLPPAFQVPGLVLDRRAASQRRSDPCFPSLGGEEGMGTASGRKGEEPVLVHRRIVSSSDRGRTSIASAKCIVPDEEGLGSTSGRVGPGFESRSTRGGTHRSIIESRVRVRSRWGVAGGPQGMTTWGFLLFLWNPSPSCFDRREERSATTESRLRHARASRCASRRRIRGEGEGSFDPSLSDTFCAFVSLFFFFGRSKGERATNGTLVSRARCSLLLARPSFLSIRCIREAPKGRMVGKEFFLRQRPRSFLFHVLGARKDLRARDCLRERDA